MSKKYRFTLMILSVMTLLIVGWSIFKNFDFIINDFWFASGLLMLVLISLIDQPHFSKDSNIFLNGVTAILSLLLVPINERSFTFWAFICFASYLIVSSYALMWLRNNNLRDENKAIQFFSRLNRQVGKPEVVFSAFFIWGGIRQFTMNSSEFNALLWFWIVFMILNIPSLAQTIENLFNKETYYKSESAVGVIFGIQSNNTFLAKVNSHKKVAIRLFDFVEFKCSVDSIKRIGLVLDIYLLNQEQWIRVLSSPEMSVLSENTSFNHQLNVVYYIDPPNKSHYTNKFIGVVCENSIIKKIRFIYNSNIKIGEGQLIEAKMDGIKVMYQVTQGTTKVEQLENKNESSSIVGDALQLGTWNTQDNRFEQHGWVPCNNTPIYIASNIENPVVENDELIIGYIPNTNYPIIINKEIAVTHHTAVLGITGSGKSVFVRNLVSNIASDNTKIIIVDLTAEYKSRFENIDSIIKIEDADRAFTAIEILAIEKAKFSNQQRIEVITQNESIIKDAFTQSIESFLQSDNSKSIFELPDISNKSDILEYTRWFFWVLFDIAKKHKNFGKRVCVVLEEAHTIIPEWNSMGVNDTASKATVNSISQIALQGRKYNIGFVVIAQRTANVSKTVLTQCNTIISFQVLDKTSNDFLSNYMGVEHTDLLSTLKFRTAVAMGKAFRSTVPMIFQVPHIEEIIYD